MTRSACAVSRCAPGESASEALPAVRERRQLAITRRELLHRAGLIAAAGMTAMVLESGQLARLTASDTTVTAAAASVPVADYARFMELVGTTFAATSIAGASLTQRARLTLEEVALLGEAGDLGRPAHLREVPYALRFILSDGELARSGIFRLEGVDREPVAAFIHQVGMRAPGADIRYEAVFN